LELPILRKTSWEWLEGRFFAQEFLLRHLLTNHSHYIFPFTRRTGSASSTPSFPQDTESTGSPAGIKIKSFFPETTSIPSSPQRPLRRSSSEDFTNSRRKVLVNSGSTVRPKLPAQAASSIINQLVANVNKSQPLFESDETVIQVIFLLLPEMTFLSFLL
jgi:hypothetical protein